MRSSSSNEKSMLTRLSKGCEVAFEELYHLYSAPLLVFLVKMVKSETNAGEILQETFIKIWNNREKIDPEKAFSTYLYQIARNNVYDFFRKLARDKKLEAALIKNISDQYFQVEEFLNHKEDVQQLYKVLDFLPPKRREVYKLVKLEERSYSEVSKILDVSVSTINDHIVKATKLLHDRFASNRISMTLAIVLLSGI